MDFAAKASIYLALPLTSELDALCGGYAHHYSFLWNEVVEQRPPSKTKKAPLWVLFLFLVETSGLEPLTPCMSSKYSNQLSYASEVFTAVLYTKMGGLSRLKFKYFKIIQKWHCENQRR